MGTTNEAMDQSSLSKAVTNMFSSHQAWQLEPNNTTLLFAWQLGNHLWQPTKTTLCPRILGIAVVVVVVEVTTASNSLGPTLRVGDLGGGPSRGGRIGRWIKSGW